MKRIDAITRSKGILSEVLCRKGSRILRQIDQAIDMAKDSAQDEYETADEIMNSFGKYAEASQTDILASKLNNYKDHILEAEEWSRVADIFAALKGKLQEEVEVEEVEDKK